MPHPVNRFRSPKLLLPRQAPHPRNTLMPPFLSLTHLSQRRFPSESRLDFAVFVVLPRQPSMGKQVLNCPAPRVRSALYSTHSTHFPSSLSPFYPPSVLIINGEVVPDSDPRAIKARGGTLSSSSFPSSTAGLNQRRPPATIHNSGGDDDAASSDGSSASEGSSVFQGKAYTMGGGIVKTPPTQPSPSSSVAAPPPGGGTYYPSPPLLQQAAEALGTQGRLVTIPAVPFLGLSASIFDLLPCLIVALGLLYFGLRGIGVLAVLYVFIKKSQDHPPQTAAVGQGRGRDVGRQGQKQQQRR